MDHEICIEVAHLSKSFKVYHDKGHTLKDTLLRSIHTKYEDRLILDDVSLSVQRGRSVGLIGKNGSGKSTLLKLLTGIIYADGGDISIQGKVSSLLELGAGFHPDFSGHDNIYINASIFGLSRKEIDLRYDRIVEFSELQDFIDNPVRTYSSGMYMRLAFSVAINVDADILFIDEILAVGDANFQRKCFDRVRSLRKEGKTIVLVTHDLAAVEKICDEAIWLDHGRIVEQGHPKRIIDQYMLFMEKENSLHATEEFKHEHIEEPPAPPTEKPASPPVDKTDSLPIVESETLSETFVEVQPAYEPFRPASCSDDRWGNNKVDITSLSIVGEAGTESHLFHSDETVTILISYSIRERIEDIVFGFGIWTKDRIQCYGTNTMLDGIELAKLPRKGEVRIELPANRLIDNAYILDVSVHSSSGIPYDYIVNAYNFNIYSNRQDVGMSRIDHTWRIPEA